LTESSSERKKATAIIIGAGPAGLTAAYELLDKTAIKPIVLEASGEIGGLCRTVIHRGNRLDIGGHRFFTKSDEVMRWWRNLLPLEGEPATHRPIGAAVAQELPPPDPRRTDAVLLSRPRLSRILFERRLFPYPLRVTREVLAQLGLGRAMRFAASMAAARARPIAPEKSLEDFFINRFGRALYETFFRSYTEKVWGAPCAAIGSDWGAQRVDGLSLGLALRHALRGMLGGEPAPGAAAATLAERFYYPKLGPGQLWEEAARRIVAAGGEIRLRTRLVGLRRCGDRIAAAIARDEDSRELTTLPGDFFFSSAPVGELIAALGDGVPEVIGEAASLLRHRSFIVVGLLLARLAMKGAAGSLPPDNWIYVQDGDVDAGRIQIFNNWSPALVADPRLVWVGVEYFCASAMT
jgi:protoporphyrinogen oxidase